MITGDIWQKVNDEILSEKSIRKFVIAYVTKKSKILRKGDFLICDASKQAIKYGKTSASTLKYYYDNGVQIYSLENLHAKFLFTENVLIVGSANLSKNSAENLTEAAIVTRKKDEISNASAFFYTLTQEAKKIDNYYLEKILKIPVVSKKNIKKKRSKSRKLEFGKTVWVVSVTPLSQKIIDNEAVQTEKATSRVSKTYDIAKENIDYIRFTGGRKTKKIRTEIRIGDLIIKISNNKERTESNVIEPTSILGIEHEQNCTKIYFDSSGLKELDFLEFNEAIKVTPMKKLSRLSLRTITEDELFYVNQIMKRYGS